MALSNVGSTEKYETGSITQMSAKQLGVDLLSLQSEFFGTDKNDLKLQAGKQVAEYIKQSNDLMQKYLDQNKTSTTKGEALNVYIDGIEDTFSQLGVPGQTELNEYLMLLDQLSSVKDTEIRKLLVETGGMLSNVAVSGAASNGPSNNSSNISGSVIPNNPEYTKKEFKDAIEGFSEKGVDLIEKLPKGKETDRYAKTFKNDVEKLNKAVEEGDRAKIIKVLNEIEDTIFEEVEKDEEEGKTTTTNRSDGNLKMWQEVRNLRTILLNGNFDYQFGEKSESFDNLDYMIPLSQEAVDKDYRGRFVENRMAVHKDKNFLWKDESIDSLTAFLNDGNLSKEEKNKYDRENINISLEHGLTGLILYIYDNPELKEQYISSNGEWKTQPTRSDLPFLDAKTLNKQFGKERNPRSERKTTGKKHRFGAYESLHVNKAGFEGLDLYGMQLDVNANFDKMSQILFSVKPEKWHDFSRLQMISRGETTAQEAYNALQYKDMLTKRGDMEDESGNKRFGSQFEAAAFFLSDYNSDSMLTSSYTKAEKKAEEGIGDKGSVFGPELFSEIMRAASTRGDALVAKNMLFVIKQSAKQAGFDEKELVAPFMKKILDAEKKADFGVGDFVGLLTEYPEAKMHFVNGIQKLTGSEQEVTSDLVEILHQDFDTINMVYSSPEFQDYKMKTDLKSAWNAPLDQYSQKEFVELSQAMGLPPDRPSVIDSLMHTIFKYVDTLSLNDWTRIISDPKNLLGQQLKKMGIMAVDTELLRTRNFVGKVIQSYISILKLGGIHWDKDKKALTLGVAAGRTSKTGKTKISGDLGLVFSLDNLKKGGELLSIGASFDFQKQVNYGAVMQSDLWDMDPAKYAEFKGNADLLSIGVEGAKVLNLSAGVGGVADALIGIQQVKNQYKYVSSTIFKDILDGDSLVVNGAYQAPNELKNRLKIHVDQASSGSRLPGGSENWEDNEKTAYLSFINNNKENLYQDIEQVIDYLYMGKEGSRLIDDVAQRKPGQSAALDYFMNVIQDGNIGYRELKQREALRGVAATGVGAGFDFSVLGLGPASAEFMGTGIDGGRVKLLGFYVGASMSYYETQYLPNGKKHNYVNALWSQGGAREVKLENESIQGYADYIKKVYNIKESHNLHGDKPEDDPMNVTVDKETGTIKILYNPAKGPRKPDYKTNRDRKQNDIHHVSSSGVPYHLNELIQIRYHEGEKNFKYIENANGTQELIIGAVGGIHPKTYVQGSTAQYLMVLGKSDAAEETKLLDPAEAKNNQVEAMRMSAELLQNEPHLRNAFTELIATPGFPGDVDKDAVYGVILSKSYDIKNGGKITVSRKKDVSGADVYEYNFVANTEITLDKYKIEIVFVDVAYLPDLDGKVVPLESSVTSELDGHRTTLAWLDTTSGNYDNFKKYMYEAALAKDAAVTNGDDYQKAYTQLVEMSSGYLKTYLHGITDPDQCRLVVNEVKGIFATNPKVHKTGTAEAVVMSRKIRWRELDWPNGNAIKLGEERNNKKETLLAEAGLLKPKNSQDKGKEIPYEVNPNLFGFTAFYRGGMSTTDVDDAMKYSMTAIGATRVLGRDNNVEKGALTALTLNEKDAVFSPDGIFFNNLEKHPDDLTQVTKAINKVSSVTLNNEQVLQLLKNPTEGVQSADGRKVTMPDLKYVFYLLGECANESFGIELGKVKVTKKEEKKWSGDDEGGEKVMSINMSVKMSSNNYGAMNRVETIALEQHVKFNEKPPKGEEEAIIYQDGQLYDSEGNLLQDGVLLGPDGYPLQDGENKLTILDFKIINSETGLPSWNYELLKQKVTVGTRYSMGGKLFTWNGTDFVQE